MLIHLSLKVRRGWRGHFTAAAPYLQAMVAENETETEWVSAPNPRGRARVCALCYGSQSGSLIGFQDGFANFIFLCTCTHQVLGRLRYWGQTLCDQGACACRYLSRAACLRVSGLSRSR